jgi:branched-chain amino acid transport system substrate-binding protein
MSMKAIPAALAGAVLWMGAAMAQGAEGPVKFGVLTDMSGTFSDLSGAGSVEAARLAIEDFGGSVLGRKIELVQADHQHKPEVGLAIAREWYDVGGVDVILDVPNSGIALAVANLAKDKKKLAIFASAATDRLTEDSCTGYGLHWTFDTYSQTNGAARALIQKGYDTWFMLVADYAYGHAMDAAMREAVTRNGGKVVGGVKHPLNTQDFSSFLLQAQATKAKMVALASGGNDTINAIKQGNEFGLDRQGQRLASLLTFITEVHSLGLQQMRGLQFVVPYYWDMDEQTRGFAKRFFERMKKMPGEAQSGVYSAVLQYLKAVQAVGSKDADKVRAKMMEMPIDDLFARNGRLLPNGRLVHDMYLIEVKAPEQSKYAWDYYKILATIPAAQAFHSIDETKCPLVKKN